MANSSAVRSADYRDVPVGRPAAAGHDRFGPLASVGASIQMASNCERKAVAVRRQCSDVGWLRRFAEGMLDGLPLAAFRRRSAWRLLGERDSVVARSRRVRPESGFVLATL